MTRKIMVWRMQRITQRYAAKYGSEAAIHLIHRFLLTMDRKYPL